MRDVVIKAVVYGRRMENGRVVPVAKGERASLPDEEAARLVALDVAVYADAPAETPATPATHPADGEGLPSQSTDAPDGECPLEAAPRGGEAVSADMEVTRLERMPKTDLERMAQDMGVDTSGARNKHDLAVLIVAASAAADGEAPPDLGAGDIVQ